MLAHEPQVLIQLAEIYNQQGEHSQAIELFTQASTLAPTDPSILERLASIYENFGDNSTAFQYFRDSFHHFPSNISLIKWLGNYYMSAHFSEKAVLYFEKAALMEPNNPEWPMLTAGCQRRSGNFQRALEIYKQVHRRFPENVECLKFLVQLSKELRLTVEERDYTEKLGRIEKIGQLKAQRESGGQRLLFKIIFYLFFIKGNYQQIMKEKIFLIFQLQHPNKIVKEIVEEEQQLILKELHKFYNKLGEVIKIIKLQKGILPQMI
ncbi:unnamed protein product [Meloidogyne enterolobii]|uniref:Uncharacterized protein n=1 Tax=Meloidogyne enterolobii TaxID=390850 RepID=A0ACB0YFR3_MELEN